MTLIDSRLERPDQPLSGIGYAEAVGMAARVMDAPLSVLEKADLGLALAQELADYGDVTGALTALSRAERDLSARDNWFGDDATPIREVTVRLLDLRAHLFEEAGQPGRALRAAHMAHLLANDIDDALGGAAQARLALVERCVTATGRADHQALAHEMFPDLIAPPKPEMAESVDMDEGFEGLSSDDADMAPRASSSPSPSAESFPVGTSAPPEMPMAAAPVMSEVPPQRGMAKRAPGEVADKPYHEVKVFYATHRNRTNRSNPYDYYRGQRAEMTQGEAIVTVPRAREAGEFRTASRRSAKSADKARLITIDTIAMIEGRSDFISSIGEEIGASERKEALLFVHGYNTSFAGAMMRAGQLSVDLDIDGATVLYSWPSRASFLSYVVDRNQVIDPFLQDLKDLIIDLAMNTGAEKVHLLAHSMGSQFMLDALRETWFDDRVRDLGRPLVKEIIFASPDVDAINFSSILERVAAIAERITVYTSKEDRALRASELLQGGTRAGRAPEIVSARGFQVVDTTAAEQDFLGHTDYAKSAIDDVRALVWLPATVTPERRDAILAPDEQHPFWHFKAAAAGPSAAVFREAISLARSVSPDRLESALASAADAVRSQIRALLAR